MQHLRASEGIQLLSIYKIAAESHVYGGGDVPHAALECKSRHSL